jgi:hypothetical protein
LQKKKKKYSYPTELIPVKISSIVQTVPAGLLRDLNLLLKNIWGYSVALLVETLRYKPEGRGFDSRW